MKISERFWTETVSRLSVAAEAALLHALLRRPPDLPLGVFSASAAAFESVSRFAWAASQIEAELSIAEGIAVDSTTKLAVVWEVALSDLPRAPMPARGHGRRVGATGASWTRELVQRTAHALDGSMRTAFEEAVAPFFKPGRGRPKPRPRPRGDDFEANLHRLKRVERSLRADFRVDDRGERPGVDDRLAVVQTMAHGVALDDIEAALYGRAEKCRRSRMWQGSDTAESFLRISWLCANKERLDDALRDAPALTPDTAVVRGPGGTFVAGRQLYEAPAVRAQEETEPGDVSLIDEWINKGAK